MIAPVNSGTDSNFPAFIITDVVVAARCRPGYNQALQHTEIEGLSYLAGNR